MTKSDLVLEDVLLSSRRTRTGSSRWRSANSPSRMHSAMHLLTRSIWKIRSSVDSSGHLLTLVGVAATSWLSDSGIREAAGAWGVRSDLTPAKTLPPVAGEPEAGFLRTVTSGKLPKVKEKPTVASIWAVTLVEKTTPVLATIEIDV